MKPILLALSLITSTVAVPAYQAGSGVEVLTDDSNIMNTTALQDLETDSSFDQSDFPKKSSLSKDIYGEYESEWQGITMTNGLKGYKYTYLYFYHPLGDVAKWVNKTTNESSFDITFRTTFSYSPNLEDYSHHSMTEVDHSSDYRFWKFVCTDDLSRMDGLDYQAYDISEFEIMKADGLGGSNSFKVGKRFSWTKNSSGSLSQSTDDIKTISIDQYRDSWMIPGVSSNEDIDSRVSQNEYDLPLDYRYLDYERYVSMDSAGTGSLTDESTIFCNEENSNNPETVKYGCSTFTSYVFSQDTIFYSIFPVNKNFGELVGCKMSFVIKDRINLLSQHILGDGKSVYDCFMADKIASKILYEHEETTVDLKSGLENNEYEGIDSWTIEEEQDKLSDFYSKLTGSPNSIFGYSDTFILPTIEKLSPSFSGDWTSGSATTYETNPDALSNETVSYLNNNYSSLKGLNNDVFIVRYYLHKNVFFRNKRGQNYDTDFSYFSYVQDTYDSDLLSLTFRLNGFVYTIGVISDSGDVLSPDNPSSNNTSFYFNWKWLYITLGIVGALAIFGGGAWLINKAIGSKQ